MIHVVVRVASVAKLDPDFLHGMNHAWVICTPHPLVFIVTIAVEQQIAAYLYCMYMYYGSKIVEGASQSSPSSIKVYIMSEGSPPR